MKEKILIVEDQFVEADYLRLMLTQAGYGVTGIAHSVLQAQEMIKKERPGLVILDIFLKGKLTGIDLARDLAEENIAFVYLSASSNEDVLNLAKTTQPYGFLVKPFRPKELLIMLQIAQYRHEHSVESNLKKENILNDKLSAIAASSEGWEKRLLKICKTLQPYIPFHYVTAGFNTLGDTTCQGLSFLRIGFDDYQKIGRPELLNITRLNMNDFSKLVDNTSYEVAPAMLTEGAFEETCVTPSLTRLFSEAFQVTSSITLPLTFSDGKVCMLCLYGRDSDPYTADHIGLLSRLQKHLTASIENMLSSAKTNTTNAAKGEETSLPGNSIATNGFKGIIGRSHLLLNVFDLITRVGPSDTSVLILGESGTGKERVADCIHNLSPRKDKPFIKVNCATLPSTLIESELFGHEKGSFTGAVDRRIGKFEKADKGTIFLDEIGEMPLDLQVKLLRVLQEKYIERIGAKDVTKVDVRIIAATNRNLEKEVAEGRFRLDLYYRLNVFPIELPPLRERSEDIPFLVSHFIGLYNQKAGKRIKGISDKVLNQMTAYAWPGNIRELENVIERSVLLADGTIIEEILLPRNQANEFAGHEENSSMKTIHENERDHILSVLKKCKGRIWGTGGAAEVLNVPPTTLRSKMKKLGIEKDSFWMGS